MMLDPLSVALNAGAKQKVNGDSTQTAVLAQVQAKFDRFADPLLAAAGCAGLKLLSKKMRPQSFWI